jgi:hypothetical protein
VERIWTNARAHTNTHTHAHVYMLCEKLLDTWKTYTHILRITYEFHILKKSCFYLKYTFGSRKYSWREKSSYEQYNWNSTNNLKVVRVRFRSYSTLNRLWPVDDCSAGWRAYWVWWNGEGWVFFLLGTSVWQGQLYLRKVRKDTRPNMLLQYWLTPSLPLDSCTYQNHVLHYSNSYCAARCIELFVWRVFVWV